MSRPELQAPPEIFYNADEANKYMQSTRMQKIQIEMACPSPLSLSLALGTPLCPHLLPQRAPWAVTREVQ